MYKCWKNRNTSHTTLQLQLVVVYTDIAEMFVDSSRETHWCCGSASFRIHVFATVNTLQMTATRLVCGHQKQCSESHERQVRSRVVKENDGRSEVIC